MPDPCPHCGIAEVPCASSRGGSNGVTESAIERGTEIMARLDPDRTPEQHARYVRDVVQGIREHLVQRHLYDAVVRELRPQNDREPRSGGSAAGIGAGRVTGGSGPVEVSRLHDKQTPVEAAVRGNPQQESTA